MSFGSFDRGSPAPQPMAEINVTPLVDVMLVLLVIFIITAPLLAYAIRLDLPDVKAPVAPVRGVTVDVSIDADGAVYWNRERVDEAMLAERLAAAARHDPPPELRLRADRATRYERVAFVMGAARNAGVVRLGFVTLPRDAAADGGHDRP